MAKVKIRGEKRPPYFQRAGRKRQPLEVGPRDLRKLWKEKESVNGVAKELGISWGRAERNLRTAGIIK